MGYLYIMTDMKTMSKRVESEQYYVTLEMFIADMKRMFANARTYNSPETIYYKCSTRHGATAFVSLYFFILFKSSFLTFSSSLAGWNPFFKAKFNRVSLPWPKFSRKRHNCKQGGGLFTQITRFYWVCA